LPHINEEFFAGCLGKVDKIPKLWIKAKRFHSIVFGICEETLSSHWLMESIQGSARYHANIWILEGVSRWTQHGSTLFSGIGASLEVGFGAVGCFDGPPGCAAGALFGNTIHQLVTNPIESTLSNVSFGSGTAADIYSGRTRVEIKRSGKVDFVVGESPVTNFVLAALGQLSPVGATDFAIDTYGSAYQENAIGGLYNLGLEAFPDWAVRGTGGFVMGAAVGSSGMTPVLTPVASTLSTSVEKFVSEDHLLYDIRGAQPLPDNWPVQIQAGDAPGKVPPARPDWFPVAPDVPPLW
jgi:hypothetical protein